MFSNLKNIKIDFMIFIFFISAATFLSFKNGYIISHDTFAMINTFEKIINQKVYIPSRPPGYFVPEIGVGLLSYYGGSFLLNITSFMLLLVGLIFFFLSLENKYNKIFLFVSLCLSNYIVFKDAIQAEDFSWSFFFFSLGFYFFKRKLFELSIIFFSLCIGSRLNFSIFIIVLIMYFKLTEKTEIKKRFFILISSLFFGSLFYLPIWLSNGLSLIWVTGYTEGSSLTEIINIKNWLSRFFYKIINVFGIVQCIVIFFLLYLKRKEIIKLKNSTFIFLAIIANLAIFLYLPLELSYLWIYIFLIYFLIIINYSKKIVYILIAINIFNWFYNLRILEIAYKYPEQEYCKGIHAIDAKYKIHFEKGYFFKIEEDKKLLNCHFINYKVGIDMQKKFISGSPLSN